MCNCISEINEELISKDRNTKIKTPLLLNSDMSSQGSRAQIVTEKINTKSKKKPVAVFASYCPFCGESYTENKTIDGDSE